MNTSEAFERKDKDMEVFYIKNVERSLRVAVLIVK